MVAHVYNIKLGQGGRDTQIKFHDNTLCSAELLINDIFGGINIEKAEDKLIYGYLTKDCQPTIHNPREARKQGGPQKRHAWYPHSIRKEKNS